MTTKTFTSLAEFIEEHSPEGFKIQYAYKNETPVEFTNIPKTNDIELHWSIARYISEIRNHSLQPFYVATGNNLHLTVLNNAGSSILSNHEGVLFEDVSTSYEFSNIQFSSPVHIDGTSVLLSVDAGSNYFHWMCHVLPKIHLLNEIKNNWNNINKIIVPQNRSAFVEETLSILNVPRNKILEAKKSDHYIFEKLVVPCKPNRHIHLSKWSLKFLKNSFLKTKQEKNRKFLVARKNALGRDIKNKDELLKFLKPLGFEEVFMEDFSVQEQAKIFNSASHIISPHGAALTNLLFCDADTKVIEIFSPNYVLPLYWNFCNILNLDYSYLIGEGERPPKGVDPHLKNESIEVNINDLRKLL